MANRMPGPLAVVVCLLCHPLGAPAADTPPPDINPDWTWVETPFGKPVIDRGPEGDWDHAAVDNPYVYVEDGRYYCFFEAQDTRQAGWSERIGLAVSLDGAGWKKRPDNPILDVGPAGSWDAVVAKLPAGVVKREGTYYLFYSGRDKPDVGQTTKSIGLATAESLKGPWRKHPGNPVLRGRSDAWDRHVTTLPVPTFFHHGRYWMLYRGMMGFYHHQGVGAVCSVDLLHWKRVERRPLIPTRREVASMGVALAAGRFVGISQPTSLAARRYWVSSDLLEWREAGPVKMNVSRAAETISNPFLVDGQWNVLYEQGDRIYRAVLTPPGE